MRKIAAVLILALLFLVGFSFSTTVFSEEEIEMKIIKGSNNNSLIKIYTPTNIGSVYLEIYHMESRFLAGIHLNYHTVEVLNDSTKNVFLLNTGVLKGKKQIHFTLFPGTQREENFWLKDLEIIEDTIETAVIQQESKGVFVEEINQLKVMSFNIHHGRSKFGAYNLNDVAKVIRDHNVDIVGLQEVDKSVYRSRFEDQIQKLAEELDMHYAYGSNIRILGAEYGNAILSKYPIESFENVILPGNRKEKRGLLMSKIRVEEEEVNFLVTHLGLNREERKKQMQAIDQFIRFLGNRVILVGDFNTTDSNIDFFNFKKYLIDTAEVFENQYQHTYDGFVFKSRIDYIFTTQDFRTMYYEVLDMDISDHFPVIAQLEL
ncbi:endonuclease/exonuclease/phosphatase family protein [Geosporobacter ferrireducens]|nr:endonuclease/exonuclease/phosphatase family protein [Geosporobacter ferrireducens]MTI53990.1 hypothetical protein [Geosporobacter ferrireducens]